MIRVAPFNRPMLTLPSGYRVCIHSCASTTAPMRCYLIESCPHQKNHSHDQQHIHHAAICRVMPTRALIWRRRFSR
jgi:hypothetical protein